MRAHCVGQQISMADTYECGNGPLTHELYTTHPSILNGHTHTVGLVKGRVINANECVTDLCLQAVTIDIGPEDTSRQPVVAGTPANDEQWDNNTCVTGACSVGMTCHRTI
jgi:hypothetical protein